MQEVIIIEAIKTVNLTKKYKDLVAVNGLNLQIMQGELFSLLGVNGAGKTTTIKMLCCLTRQTEGDAFVNGHSIKSDSEKVKQVIGVSPQQTAIAPNLSVRENLELICGIHGFSKNKTARKIRELSDEFNLSELLSKRASKLSQGKSPSFIKTLSANLKFMLALAIAESSPSKVTLPSIVSIRL